MVGWSGSTRCQGAAWSSPTPAPSGPARSPRAASRAGTHALALPTFEAGGTTLLRRLTLIVDGGRIADVVYPVFPPDRGAELALERL